MAPQRPSPDQRHWWTRHDLMIVPTAIAGLSLLLLVIGALWARLVLPPQLATSLVPGSAYVLIIIAGCLMLWRPGPLRRMAGSTPQVRPFGVFFAYLGSVWLAGQIVRDIFGVPLYIVVNSELAALALFLVAQVAIWLAKRHRSA